jgi:Protein of unknown function (DUF3237)
MPSDWNPAANLQRRSLLQWCGAGLAGAGLAVAATQSRAAASAHTDTTANAPPLEEFPHLEFVYTAIVGIAAIEDVGDTVSGHQRLIPITGGTFEGPRLRGKVLPGAADWNLQRNDGVTVVSASYFLQTDDGVYIKILNQGINPKAAPGPGGRPRFTVPCFEAPKGRYEWLNQAVFVGTLRPGDPGTVRIQVFKLI